MRIDYYFVRMDYYSVCTDYYSVCAGNPILCVQIIIPFARINKLCNPINISCAQIVMLFLEIIKLCSQLFKLCELISNSRSRIFKSYAWNNILYARIISFASIIKLCTLNMYLLKETTECLVIYS